MNHEEAKTRHKNLKPSPADGNLLRRKNRSAKARPRSRGTLVLGLVRSAPPQLQAAMAGVIEATRKTKNGSIGTGEAYDAYKRFCQRVKLRPLTGRAFGDLISELDIYSLLRSRVLSRGRYGRTREIILDLSQGLTEKIHSRILLNFEIHG